MTKKEALIRRHRLLMETRRFFDEADFIEITTPLLVLNPGMEPHLVPFETRFEKGMHNREDRVLYLPTSPEYHLKKALGQFGFPRVFEITKSFRNGELGIEHEPEFLILEWYRAPGNYGEIATDLTQLMARLGGKAWATAQHLTVCEAFSRFAGIDLLAVLRGDTSLGGDFSEEFQRIMVEKIEPHLGFDGPLFLWDYPATECALARLKPGDPLLCERFEVYWQGIELANAFGELTDATEQRRRCLDDQKKRVELYGRSPPLDEEFFAALEKMPSAAGGIAVGLDRLFQCLLGLARLQDGVAFPHGASI